jgi:hypothetical protein
MNVAILLSGIKKLESIVLVCKLCRDVRNDEESEASTTDVNTSGCFVLVRRTARHKVCRECGTIKEKMAAPHDYLLKRQEVLPYFDQRS